MFRSNFFYPSVRSKSLKRFVPNLLFRHSFDESGRGISELVDSDSQQNPLVALTYEDFTISSMLKRGVSYKSLQISSDLRLGFDSEISQFNDYLVENADNLFNPQN